MTATYPVDVQLDAPLEVARWRPFVHWLLVIPHAIVAEALGFVAFILAFIGWFAIIFTGRLPDFVSNFVTMTLRYNWRMTSYQYWLREPYPPFDFDSTMADDGLDPPTRFVVQPPAGSRNRLTTLFRGVLVIPHFIALGIIGIAAEVVLLISAVAILFTGRWPEGLREFVIGFYRWGLRVGAYYFLLVDEYPPFSLT